LKEIIDLSQTIVDNLPVFPGDIRTSLFQTKYLSIDKYNDHRLEVGMHAGTHIDGPMHLTESREYISDLAPEIFIAPGCLLDVRNQPVIQWQPEFAESVAAGSIVLLSTGMDKVFGNPGYFTDYPEVSAEFCQRLVDKKIKMLGLDSASPDRFPYLIHKQLLANGIYVIENLTNLVKLAGKRSFEVIALPLKIKANGSPARVVARIVG
jgi:kynurenine formamidase